MKNNAYTRNVAEIYDLIYADSSGDIGLMVEYLKGITSGDKVLELAVGTGRIAFPMAGGGFDVTGVDNSLEMLEILAKKNTNGSLRVVHGDMIAGEVLRESFDIVLLMCNTLFVARNLAEQIKIFTNAARSLADDGFFVLETFNPLLYVDPSRNYFQLRRLTREISLMEQFSIDSIEQTLHSYNVVLEPKGSFSYEETVRFMFPNEMDAVASQAGLSLDRRMSDWTGMGYEAMSPRCISMYRRSLI